MTFHRMACEVGKGIDGDRERARTDRDMRLRHTDDVEQQRCGKNGPATTDQPQHEADKPAGPDGCDDVGCHDVLRAT